MSVYVQTNQPITLGDGNAVITIADTGKTFLINDQGANHTATLPSPLTAGLHYVFINRAMAANNNMTVEAGAGLLHGLLIRVGVAVATGAGAGGHLNFIGGTSLVGDRAEFYSDGVQWSCMAFSNAGAGITAT